MALAEEEAELKQAFEILQDQKALWTCSKCSQSAWCHQDLVCPKCGIPRHDTIWDKFFATYDGEDWQEQYEIGQEVLKEGYKCLERLQHARVAAERSAKKASENDSHYDRWVANRHWEYYNDFVDEMNGKLRHLRSDPPADWVIPKKVVIAPLRPSIWQSQYYFEAWYLPKQQLK